jgi:hypothetical protein
MVIADQRSTSPAAENFVLFPFTHPVVRRKRDSSSRCLPLEINMVTDTVSTRHAVSTVSSKARSDFESHARATQIVDERLYSDEGDERGDIVDRVQPNLGERSRDERIATKVAATQFPDFAREHLNAKASTNVLSRESMLVQVGQPDMCDVERQSEQVDHANDFDESFDTLVFGPSPPSEQVDTDGTLVQVNNEQRVSPSKVTPKGHILMLETKLGMNRTQVQNQQRATMLFNARHIPYETIDGSDPANKEIRNELFKLSEMRGVYPQFFVVSGETTTFLGDWETVENINDATSLGSELLEANPTLLTWDRIPGLFFK